MLSKYIKKIKPKIIFHLAAKIISKSYEDPTNTYEINSGTLNLIDIKKNNFIKSSIFITSDKCYESNNSTKGFKENDKLGGIDPSGSKACAEIIITPTIIVFLKINSKEVLQQLELEM